MVNRRLTFSLLPALLVIAALGAPSVASSSTRCANADLVPTATNLTQVSRATVCLVNVERKLRQRKALRTSEQLERAARTFSVKMVSEGFFAHVSPGGSTLTTRVRGGTSYLRGARTWALAENLGWGTGELSTPRHTVRAWMESPGHRVNVLSPRYGHIGVGVTAGSPTSLDGRSAATYTADFGSRT